MKRLFSLFLIFLALLPGFSHAQSYQWVKGGGSACSGSIYRLLDKVTNIVTDEHRNIYSLASIGDLTIVADTFHLTRGFAGAHCDQQILLTSYNCNGTMRFAKFIQSYATSLAYDMVYDGAAGIYVTGVVTGDGGTIGSGSKRFFGYDTVVATKNYNSFLIKYDTSGKMKWLRFLGQDIPANETKYMHGCGLAMDGTGNVHMLAQVVTGIQLTSSIITQGGNYDIIYGANGTLRNATKLPIDSSYKITKAFINKTSGSIYLRLEGYTTLNNFKQTLCCIKNNSIAWIDTTDGYKQGIGGIDYDGGNELYITLDGQLSSTFHFGGLSGSNSAYTGKSYATVIKLDTNGVGKWSYQLDGNSGVTTLTQPAVLPNGSVGVAGLFSGIMKNGSDSIVSTASESVNPFLLILDNSGKLVKLDQQHGAGYTDGGIAMASDNIGNLYFGGYYESTMTATGLGAGISSTGGSADFWLMKYGYTCNCAVPAAKYISAAPSGKSVSYTYNGTTTSIDSLVWNWGDGQKQTVKSGFTSPLSHTFSVNGRYNVCVTAYGQCGTNTFCQQTPLSVSGMAAFNGVSIYPNPAATYFTVEGANGATITLSNAVGQVVKNFSLTTDKEVLDISGLAAGVYVLQLTDKTGNRGVTSFVKQ
ncbi:MAG: T9SS type A sorting domain-containing protein [Chitinophagaceae bacterium]